MESADEDEPRCPFCDVAINAENTTVSFEETEDPFPNLYRLVTCLNCQAEYSLHLTPINMMIDRAPNLESITI